MKKKSPEDQMTLAGTEEGEILSRLGERVEKVVQTIQELRRERDALKARLETVEAELGEQERFRKERSEIRDRIENILSSLEALE